MTMQKIDAHSPDAQSADLRAANIAQLKALFPELLTEGPQGAAINVDVLKSLVGDATVTDADEKYGLNWHGKRRARQLALTPSTGTLRPAPEDSVDWDTTQNLMIEGDNLEVLKLLQKSYAGKVKLIYIDPPYNTGKDFVYPDNFQDNIRNYLELTGQVEGGQKISSNTEASGRFHTDWLNMMYPRLKLAKNLLKKSGTLCVSLSDVEISNFRLMADEIFGGENFLAVVSWEKVHTRKNSARTFSVSHDYVIIYARDIDDWDRILLPREGLSAYKNPDEDPKGPWKPDPITAHNPYSADYKIIKPNGVTLSRPEGRYWAFSESTWKEKILKKEVLWGEGGAYPMIKRYLSEVQDGLVPITIFSREFAGDTALAKKEVDELFGMQGVFDYPKPTLLIQRLIQITTRPEELVVDFFSGSGTTGHAVMRQNSLDGSNRKYILIQFPESLNPEISEQKTAAEFCDQLGKPRTIAELTKERLRRAAAKIRATTADPERVSGQLDLENTAGQPALAPALSQGEREQEPQQAALDLGFRVFKLDTSNIRAWNPAPDDLEASLFEHQEHLLPGRSAEDVLYEVLLKLGLDLCVPIDEREIAGQRVHAVGGGVLMACLAEHIPTDAVPALADGIADWHGALSPVGDATCIFRDSAFADDVAKTNMAAALQQRGIASVRSL